MGSLQSDEFHSRFMELNNLFETVVHYFLIWGMINLGYQDSFPMVRALVYVMHIRQDLWWIMT